MLREKYQSVVDLANQLGVSNLSVEDGEGFIRIHGTAPSDDVKQQIRNEHNRIDPEYRTGDLVLDIDVGGMGGPSGGGGTYTVQSGDNLSKIGSKYGVSWQQIYEANRDILNDPDKIQPGQELKIP
ncbi:MAG: LysM peptidoglycan-binding domain-containing protein [Pyrinomonadaceae bacterium]